MTVVTESEVAWLFVAAGVLVWFWRAPPRWLRQGRMNAVAVAPVAAASSLLGTMDSSLLSQLGAFFAKAGAFVFGSGLAIVPFLYGGVVTEHHWLNEKQFVDAVAVAMITPGPVVITVGFIGYLVAGLPGACVAALGTFLPCYLFTILPAPYFKKYGKLPSILAFVDGVTAAAVGAITGAVIVLAKRSIVDVPTALLAVATVLLGIGILCFGLVSISGLAWLIPFLLLFTLGMGGTIALRPALVRHYFGRARFGSVFGLIMGVTMLGTITSPGLTGWVYDITGEYSVIWFIYAGISLLALLPILTCPRSSA